jgi:predicted RNase H-like HicB family nuclease
MSPVRNGGGVLALYTYPITIEKERKLYYASSEDFPGVCGLGKTIEGAKESILKAMRLSIEQPRKARKPVPAPRTIYAETVTIAVDSMPRARELFAFSRAKATVGCDRPARTSSPSTPSEGRS